MKKTHILFIILTVLLSVLLFIAVAFAEEVESTEPVLSGTCGDSLTWQYDPDTYTLTVSGTGDMNAYKSTKKIPWTSYTTECRQIIIEEGVKSIGKNAFKGFSKVQLLQLPDSLETIGQSAFANCYSISYISMPSSLKQVDSGAFSKCTGLTAVNINDIINWCNVQFADKEANPAYYASEVFVNGSALVSLTVPDGVEKLDYILMGFTELVSVKLPETVKSIGNYAFCDCQNLVSIDMPEGLETIGDYAFCGCYSLTSLKVPDSVKTIGNEAFSGCVAITKISLGGSLVSIGDNAFEGCYGITEIAFPDNLVSIGSEAFADCTVYNESSESYTGLKKISFGRSITTIGSGAFSGNTLIKSVTLPEKLTDVSDKLFYGCEALETVTLPSEISSIGSSAFAYCVKLSEIVIPNSVISIGSDAFSGCEKLKTIYFGPKPVTGTTGSSSSTETSGLSLLAEIGSGAFSGCGVSYTTDSTTNASVTQKSINIYISDIKAWCYTNFADEESNPMNDGGATSARYTLRLYLNGNSLTDLNLSSEIGMVSAYAFVDAKCIKSVSISSALKGIGLNAFDGCTGISSVKYTGTEEQWKKISISSGNEVITGKTIKDGTKMSVKNIRTTGGYGSGSVPGGKFNVTFTIDNLFASSNVMAVVMCYDASGRFVSQSSLVIKGGENSTETYKIPVDNRSGKISAYKLVTFDY